MDMQRPDIETAEPPATGACSQLSRVALRCLLRILSTTLPVRSGESEEIAAEKWETARELFFAMEPRNVVEAMLAARAVAAQFACMDLYTRAAQPGIADDKVIRLRGKASSEARSSDAALREIARRHAQADKAAKAAAAAAQPKPAPAERPGGRPAVDLAAKPWLALAAGKPGEVRPPGVPQPAAT